MANFSNRIVGLIRFSYPAEGGFAKSPAEAAALESFLFDPDRLERRFYWFEKLTLPSLLAQSDANFETLVLIGKNFPDAALAHLKKLLAPLPGARITARPRLPHYAATRRALGSGKTGAGKDGATSHVTSFRLDDDDALACGYIAKLRRLAAELSPVVGASRPFVIGFNRGFYLEQGPKGAELYDVREKLPLGIGLAMVAPTAYKDNVFRRNHRFMPMYYPTFTEAEIPYFIRSVHRDNDANPAPTGCSREMSQAEISNALAAQFNWDLIDLLSK